MGRIRALLQFLDEGFIEHNVLGVHTSVNAARKVRALRPLSVDAPSSRPMECSMGPHCTRMRLHVSGNFEAALGSFRNE